MSMQIAVTDGNGKPTEIITVLAPAGDTGLIYRDTAAQIARIAAAYKPRKPAYRDVAAQLRLAA